VTSHAIEVRVCPESQAQTRRSRDGGAVSRLANPQLIGGGSSPVEPVSRLWPVPDQHSTDRRSPHLPES
jgi:hypothetical protein